VAKTNSSTAKQPRGVLVQKPKTSIFTVMLIVTFLALLVGCLLLYLELRMYP
jgi:hypothetical protein